jgi:putative transcriptional regulator
MPLARRNMAPFLRRRLAMKARGISILLMVLAIGLSSAARAADFGQPLMLVATPHLNHAVYGGSVLFAAPIGDGRHIGFIVNRPTQMRLGQLFPEHTPSQKIPDPVYFGGPSDSGLLFAIVERNENPGGISMPLGRGLFLTFDGATVDRIIESEPQHARFFTGLVVWRSGELEDEVKRGLWYVGKPEASVVLRKSTKGLWEEMVTRSQMAAT